MWSNQILWKSDIFKIFWSNPWSSICELEEKICCLKHYLLYFQQKRPFGFLAVTTYHQIPPSIEQHVPDSHVYRVLFTHSYYVPGMLYVHRLATTITVWIWCCGIWYILFKWLAVIHLITILPSLWYLKLNSSSFCIKAQVNKIPCTKRYNIPWWIVGSMPVNFIHQQATSQ